MKALLRWGFGLLGLFWAVSVSHGYDWISPVTKCPLGTAPNMQTCPQYYIYGSDGRLYGPYWYVVPPFPPQRGFLPGPIGRAIMSGCLPHELLMCKEAMTVGDMPMLGQKKGEDGPPMGATPPMGGMPPSPPGHPWAQYPAPYPPQGPGMYAQPMAPSRPLAYAPPYGGMNPYAYAQRDPVTGIWQVQNVAQPQPSFTPPAPQPVPSPMAPRPGMPMMPQGGPPVMLPPQSGFYFLNPAPGFEQFVPQQRPMIQGDFARPNLPRPEYTPMDLPRMDTGVPPQPPQQPNAFPTHPFVRSPRDFFMFTETMQDEKNRGNRPFPVP